MPKENRKRGKKHKKVAEPEDVLPPQQQKEQPSWIVAAPEQQLEEETNPEAPFGYVDADIKAYFRTVDVQIRDWQENQAQPSEDVDPNEEKHMFFVAALTEMGGKEKQLATDPDCSIILERMTYSMDDFVRRVFVDSLSGSYEALAKHRFASHVCQTLFTVAADTVSREHRGVLPPLPELSDKGELRTMTTLILDICEELLRTLPALLLDPFASHVIRALLLLLSPNSGQNESNTTVRSKKSAAWKARQGPLKSVFEEKGKGKATTVLSTPSEFREMAAKIVRAVLGTLDENEVRAMAGSKVASPVLQILLEVEAELGLSSLPDSLMDRLTVGVVTLVSQPNSTPSTISSNYLPTLLVSPTSSHLLETLLLHAPQPAFTLLWDAHFSGNLKRLSTHPVANFVVARAVERCGEDELKGIVAELGGSAGWGGLSKSGVLRALIDRASTLKVLGSEINEIIYSAFGLETPEDKKSFLVPCVLRLKGLEEYKSVLASLASSNYTEEQHQIAAPNKYHRGGGGARDDPLEPKVPGAVLLQSLLRLPEPFNQLVTDSITAQPMDDLLSIAHHATSSRVLDALLESPTVPFKTKRHFVMSLIGNYHRLVDDRIGSRVGDRCWAWADTYLKEKIAKSMIPYEQFLAGSFYGKFFARNLNLYVLQRRPEEWKTMQAERSRLAASSNESTPLVKVVTNTANPTTVVPETEPLGDPKKKRKRGEAEDEIDAVFSANLGSKVKKGALAVDLAAKHAVDRGNGGTTELSDVLGAIRAAPKGETSSKRKKTKTAR